MPEIALFYRIRVTMYYDDHKLYVMIYDDWKWILVRLNDGQWKYVDHGYF